MTLTAYTLRTTRKRTFEVVIPVTDDWCVRVRVLGRRRARYGDGRGRLGGLG